MRRLNLEVDQEKRQPAGVVERFLKSQGLLAKNDYTMTK
jgi:hypothetical protein